MPNQAYFYANFWFCTRTFPAGDSNLRQFFFLLTRLKFLKTPEDDSGSLNLASATKDQKTAANSMRPRVCHKMSSRRLAVGVISFSSRPIRTSHSDSVFIDRTMITPMQI